MLFGVIVPTLGAGAKLAALEEDVIAACLEMQEKAYECREAYADAVLDLQLAKTGGVLNSVERASVIQARVEVSEREIGRPLEARRAGCRSFIERLDGRTKAIAFNSTPARRSCHRESTCERRARCFVGVLEEIGLALQEPPLGEAPPAGAAPRGHESAR